MKEGRLPVAARGSLRPLSTAAELRSPIASLRGVTRSFNGRSVLRNIDLDLYENEFVALIGRSGSGKSTLLRILSGLDKEAAGSVLTEPAVGYVFQDARLVPWRRVWENVTLGFRGKRAWLRQRSAEALEEVRLRDKLDDYPLALSGGQAQRVAIARALLGRPRLLLLDEPFGALDAFTRMQMQSLVSGLWSYHRMSALLVTHDVEEAVLLADRILILAEGRIIAEHRVSLPHPRDRTDPNILPLRRALLADLGLRRDEI